MIQTRELLGYYDATELSLLTGKPSRPVTLLVFTDKIMVVKRKNANIKGKDYLDKIEEKVKSTMSSSMLQKAKEAYNGFPFEFKGWADIRAVELFQGLKGIVYYDYFHITPILVIRKRPSVRMVLITHRFF